MEKQKMLVNMDNIITTGGFLYLINQFLGTEYKEEDIEKLQILDQIPNQDAFYKWFVCQNIYDHCNLLPNAYEVLQELNENYDLFIGSSYLFPELLTESGHILKQKFDYLIEKLPFINPTKYLFLVDFSLLNISIKIDNKIESLENAKQKYLFTSYHNLDISKTLLQDKQIERVGDWNEVKRKILKK